MSANPSHAELIATAEALVAPGKGILAALLRASSM